MCYQLLFNSRIRARYMQLKGRLDQILLSTKMKKFLVALNELQLRVPRVPKHKQSVCRLSRRPLGEEKTGPQRQFWPNFSDVSFLSCCTPWLAKRIARKSGVCSTIVVFSFLSAFP